MVPDLDFKEKAALGSRKARLSGDSTSVDKAGGEPLVS